MGTSLAELSLGAAFSLDHGVAGVGTPSLKQVAAGARGSHSRAVSHGHPVGSSARQGLGLGTALSPLCCAVQGARPILSIGFYFFILARVCECARAPVHVCVQVCAGPALARKLHTEQPEIPGIKRIRD